MLLFQLHYTANLLPPAIFDKFKIFFSKNPSFFQNSSIYLTFLRNLSNRVAVYRVAFYSKLATINEFWKTETFFGITLFWKEPNFRTFWEISLFHLYSASFCLSSACFKKFKFRFKKKTSVFLHTPNFDLFEKSYCISCILQQICYDQHFLKVSLFFWKTYIFFKKTQILIVLRNLTVSFAFDIKLVNCSCFQFSENWSFFFKKSMCFLSSIKWTFREIITLQSILWHVCYFKPFNKKVHDFFSRNPSIFLHATASLSYKKVEE